MQIDHPISKTSVCFKDYITPSDSSFTLNKTPCGVVHHLVSSLRVNKATGLDGISARLLKEACPEIVPSLADIINLWKISKGLPLYKEDIKSNPNNYRPISILPVVSKIIERLFTNNLKST